MNRALFQKYLQTYAEIEARELLPSLLCENPFDCGLALPLRGENPKEIEARLSTLQRIASVSHKRLIVIAVINGVGETQPEYHRSHTELISHLTKSSSDWKDCFLLEARSPFLSVLWIDRALLRPFHSKQGVGLARKIGCDVLVRLRSEEVLKGPWLFTSDGDAELPEDYFEVPESNSAAFHYPYRHICHEFEGKQALCLYELHLRYYFLGLLWARSPYAYPTIGSCLAINSDSYVHARGFQDRQAGEDFHLLNKLRKLGPIEYRSSKPVQLRGRFSERVPFGTGQSTINIHAQLQRQEPFTLYNPKTFSILKDFLALSNKILELPTDLGQEHFRVYLASLNDSFAEFYQALAQLQVPKIFDESFKTRATAPARLRHFHTSFDALKTLRLIHLIEQSLFPPVHWNEAVRTAPFCESAQTNLTAEETLQWLQRLEEVYLGSRFLRVEGL